MEKVFIFDLDGTLAKMSGRSPYAYDDVLGDTPIQRVVQLHDILAKQEKVIYVSGRPEECRYDTTAWLRTHVKNVGIELYMRATKDNRSDDIVKKEILDKLLEKYEILGIFDDRDRVVKMWRENGLQCYQVNYGNF